jgi:hypothetical protein
LAVGAEHLLDIFVPALDSMREVYRTRLSEQAELRSSGLLPLSPEATE